MATALVARKSPSEQIEPLLGLFRLDLAGAGLLALIQYVAALAILLVTMAVTRNRSRVDRVLFTLMIAKTVICLPIAELLSRPDIVSAASLDVGVVRNADILGRAGRKVVS
jgi:hypothetical protein